jgi:1-deoxy-D-xylulose-5-phosphate synthase
MINTSVHINDRPSAFRYPRGNGIGIEIPNISETLTIGKGRVVKEGKQVAILNFGARLEECKKAAEILSKKGIKITIVDARFAKPLDEKLIMEIATNHEVVISIEEGSIGGFGSHVMQFLSERGVFDKGLKFRSMFLPDLFIDQDTPEKMYEKAGLDSLSIVNKIEETLNSNIILAKNRTKIIN